MPAHATSGAVPRGPEDLCADWVRQAFPSEPPWRDVRPGDIRIERIGVGYSMASDLARIRVDVVGGAPIVFVAKWGDAARGAREARFYREVAPLCGIDLPQLLGECVDGKRSLLLLSDVSPAKQGDVLVGATPREARALAETEARFHGRLWGGRGAEALAFLPSWHVDPSPSARVTRERLPAFLERHGDRLPSRARSVIERLPELVPSCRAALADTPSTLVHVDLHLDNVLFRRDGTPVILDWTEAVRGPAAIDFSMLLLSCMRPDVRKQEEAKLAERYATALAAQGVKRYGAGQLMQDATCAGLLLMAGFVRWAGRTPDPREEGPRVRALIDASVSYAAAWIADANGRLAFLG